MLSPSAVGPKSKDQGRINWTDQIIPEIFRKELLGLSFFLMNWGFLFRAKQASELFPSSMELSHRPSTAESKQEHPCGECVLTALSDI
jgi:hypothetical protein